jgi:hypothetical protein
MDDADGLPAGWVRWSDGEDRLVLAYRPDVFDGGSFPPPCLPALYVTRGARNRRPGVDPSPPADAQWHVTLYLEPEVSRDPERYDSREAAVAGARDLARRFAEGDVDYRALYQVPREEYYAKLDELTGQDS